MKIISVLIALVMLFNQIAFAFEPPDIYSGSKMMKAIGGARMSFNTSSAGTNDSIVSTDLLTLVLVLAVGGTLALILPIGVGVGFASGISKSKRKSSVNPPYGRTGLSTAKRMTTNGLTSIGGGRSMVPKSARFGFARPNIRSIGR
jgi:hypothetical protein